MTIVELLIVFIISWRVVVCFLGEFNVGQLELLIETVVDKLYQPTCLGVVLYIDSFAGT